MIQIEIKKIKRNPALYISIFIMFVALYFGIYQERSSDILYLFENTTTIGIVHLLLPALVVLPYAATCAEEINSNYYRYTVIRSNVPKYIISRILASIIAAILVCLMAEIIFIMVIMIFKAGYIGKGIYSDSLNGTFYEVFYENGKYIIPLICKMYAFSINGIIWSLFALVLSCFTGNKYVVVAGPFLAQTAFSFFAELFGVPLLNPGLLLIKGPIHGLPYGGLIHVTLYQICGIAILGSIVWIIMSRRIKNG